MIKNLKDLENIKSENEKKINKKENIRINIGMATCGIAAGADSLYYSLKRDVDKMDLKNICVKKVGCIGMCQLEPIVEIFDAKFKRTTYVKMTPHKMKRVLLNHIVKGEILKEFTIHVANNQVLNDYIIIK